MARSDLEPGGGPHGPDDRAQVPTRGPERLPDFVWVLVQFALGAALAVVPDGSPWMPFWGAWGLRGVAIVLAFGVIGIAATRLGKALTPNPTPVSGADLATSGVYAWVRHPMYSAVIMAAWLYALPSGQAWKPALALALHLWMVAKCRHEERLLVARYPGYEAYTREVPRFVPRPPRRPRAA